MEVGGGLPHRPLASRVIAGGGGRVRMSDELRHAEQRVAAPNTYQGGFDPKDVAEGRYGRQLHFWDWEISWLSQSVDLGEDGLIPHEIRFHHDPESTHGFVGAALTSNM